jgi:hypothetical protein
MDVDGPGAVVPYGTPYYEVVSEAWIAACDSSEERWPLLQPAEKRLEAKFRI